MKPKADISSEELKALIEKKERGESTAEEDVQMYVALGEDVVQARFMVKIERGESNGDLVELSDG